MRPSPEAVAHDERPRYSVVVSVYRNAPTLAAVVEQLGALAHELDGPLEVIWVVDGSPDRSHALLRELLPTAPFTSQLIALSRNFGAESATTFGLSVSRGEFVANFAADLQEPTSLLRDIFAALATGEHDIAVGVRSQRYDPFAQTLNAKVYWFFYRRLVMKEIPEGGVSVFGCTRQVADEYVKLTESHSPPVGLIYWLGFRRIEIPYVRGARLEGKSAWTFARKVRSMFDSVYSFTDLPVTVITTVGAVGVVVSFVLGLMILFARLAGTIPIKGYASLMLVLVAIGSSVLFSLGIIGSYVWRTYENTKHRPIAIPMMRQTFGPASTGPNAEESVHGERASEGLIARP